MSNFRPYMPSHLVRSATKVERRQVLPLRFKLGCWMLVGPLFAASIACILQAGSNWWFFAALLVNVVALIVYAMVEIRSVEWLQRNLNRPGFEMGRY